VREALVVSAVLRLYEGRARHLLQAFVDDVLQLVELTPNRDMMVSDAALQAACYSAHACACVQHTMCCCS
jgi:hypothetical protein